jgi:hypothetical protein
MTSQPARAANVVSIDASAVQAASKLVDASFLDESKVATHAMAHFLEDYGISHQVFWMLGVVCCNAIVKEISLLCNFGFAA